MTPSTPSIPHIYALSSKLDEFFAEGLDARYARHKKTNQMTRDWAKKHGFTLFAEPGFESLTLTCVNNGAKPGGRTVDVAKLQKLTKDQGFLIDGGYGKIKGTTFRVSNMGDETEATMGQLFAAMDKAMARPGAAIARPAATAIQHLIVSTATPVAAHMRHDHRAARPVFLHIGDIALAHCVRAGIVAGIDVFLLVIGIDPKPRLRPVHFRRRILRSGLGRPRPGGRILRLRAPEEHKTSCQRHNHRR